MHELAQVLLQPGAQITLVELEQLEKDLPTVSRKGMAIAISVLVALLAAPEWLPLVAAVLLGTVAMVASGCLRPVELQRAIRLDVILLLGSLACFSVALEKTGLAVVCGPAGGFPVHHPAHGDDEQCRHCGPGLRVCSAVRRQPELPQSGRPPDQSDGVRAGSVPVSGYHALWLASYAHHDGGGAPADLPTLQPLGIVLGPGLRLLRCLLPPQGAAPTGPPPATLRADLSLFFSPLPLP
jgi:hypothetical protein